MPTRAWSSSRALSTPFTRLTTSGRSQTVVRGRQRADCEVPGRSALVNADHTPVVLPGVFGRQEHPGALLGHPARCHPRPTGRRLPRQIRPHPLDLAVVVNEPHHRDLAVGGEAAHRATKRGADPLQDRRRRDRFTRMLGPKAHPLTFHLQIRHITVQIDPIQTLIEHHMPVEHIVYRHCNRTAGPAPHLRG